jgi:hypothetical protein
MKRLVMCICRKENGDSDSLMDDIIDGNTNNNVCIYLIINIMSIVTIRNIKYI